MLRFLIISVLAAGVIYKIGGWLYKSGKPVSQVKAKVADMDVVRLHRAGPSRIGAAATYYATFKLKNGRRKEFRIGRRAWHRLNIDDEGILKYQGKSFVGFDRE